jgi:hypothetical protein
VLSIISSFSESEKAKFLTQYGSKETTENGRNNQEPRTELEVTVTMKDGIEERQSLLPTTDDDALSLPSRSQSSSSTSTALNAALIGGAMAAGGSVAADTFNLILSKQSLNEINKQDAATVAINALEAGLRGSASALMKVGGAVAPVAAAASVVTTVLRHAGVAALDSTREGEDETLLSYTTKLQ